MRIVVDTDYRDHCQAYFKVLRVMLLPTLSIYFQLLEIHRNKENFARNSLYHNYKYIIIYYKNIIKVKGVTQMLSSL